MYLLNADDPSMIIPDDAFVVYQVTTARSFCGLLFVGAHGGCRVCVNHGERVFGPMA